MKTAEQLKSLILKKYPINPEQTKVSIKETNLVKYQINFIDGSSIVVVLTNAQRDHIKRTSFYHLVKNIGGLGHVTINEGWILSFNTELQVNEIQKDDDSNIFKNDAEALKFVEDKANKGSKKHIDAIAQTKQKLIKKISIKPTHGYSMSIYIAVLQNGNSEGKKIAAEELMNIAKFLDQYEQREKELIDALILSQRVLNQHYNESESVELSTVNTVLKKYK